MVAEAHADAAATLAAGKTAAAKIIETARADGRRVAEARTETQMIAAERVARSLVLDAQHGVEEEARTRALAAAMSFREQPEYKDLLYTLEASARLRLGATTEIERDPPSVGGIRARLSRRSLDYTLTSLVEHALTSALAEIAAPVEIAAAASAVAK
jgi:hypothetical protein